MSAVPYDWMSERAFDTLVDEDELAVWKWRRSILMERGVSFVEARLLAESHADLHQMVVMLEQGCTPAILMRIVL